MKLIYKCSWCNAHVEQPVPISHIIAPEQLFKNIDACTGFRPRMWVRHQCYEGKHGIANLICVSET